MNRRWYTRPVLFVAEIERAAAFYIEKLGFHESWRQAGLSRSWNPISAKNRRASSAAPSPLFRAFHNLKIAPR